jgi:alpha-beta hydrolase superfamily lysophospholipase
MGAGGRVERGTTRDGTSQLRRSWPAERPWATVLVVHGISEHSGRYGHVAALANAAGIEVVSFDQRGFGGSGGRRGDVEDFDTFIDDVAERLDALRDLPRPVVLLGHSMGGLIALCCVLDRPVRPDALVLSGPALGATVPAPLRLAARVVPRFLPRLRVPMPIRSDQLSTDPVVAAAFDADPLVVRRASARLGAGLLARMAWAGRHLHRLEVPTLVVHGGDDTVVPAASSAPLASVAGVTRIVYPGLRHEVLNEPDHPAVVADIVRWVADEVGVVDPRIPR